MNVRRLETEIKSMSSFEEIAPPRDASPPLLPEAQTIKDIAKISKLPALSQLLSHKLQKNVDRTIEEAVVEVVKYATGLEEQLHRRERELKKLHYTTEYFVLALKKRDEMISTLTQENQQIKELNILYERMLHEQHRHLQKILQKGALANDPSVLKMVKHHELKASMSPSNGGSAAKPGRSASVPKTHQPLPAPTSPIGLKPTGRKSIMKPNSQLFQQLEEAKVKKLSEYHGGYDVNRVLSGGNIGPKRVEITKNVEERQNTSTLVMNETEALGYFNENPVHSFLETLLKEEDSFMQRMLRADHADLGHVYDTMKVLRSENKANFMLILRMKRIIKAANSLIASLPLTEALKKLVGECCGVLDCDRTSVFIVDYEREELWSKVFSGSNATIRIPMSKGIVGHVATKGEPLNIADAYQDPRFNKEVDIRTNYKTRTILCTPIIEENNTIVGVIQSINKTGGPFTKDDEGILAILASLAAIVLRNAMNFDEQSVFHRTLREALKTGIFLSSVHIVSHLCLLAEAKLLELLGVEECRVFITDREQPTMIRRFIKDAGAVSFPNNCGLAGHCFQKGKVKSVRNAYNHHRFNGKIDIEVSMPILCVPVLHPLEKKSIGVIEMTYSKGIIGVANGKKPVVSPQDLETLDFFALQFAQALLNDFELEDHLGSSVRSLEQYSPLVRRTQHFESPQIKIHVMEAKST